MDAGIDMSYDVYRKLAERLDQIPNGFASTDSGVELELLAKLFTPSEALIASVMKLTPEDVPAIAERAGLEPDETGATLEGMLSRGLIRAHRSREGACSYGLIPFAVGIYENQLTRMDVEMAELFERYYVESNGGGFTSGEPALHRVIPVGRTVKQDLEIFPYEEAARILSRARSWGVRDCICRVQRKLIGKECGHTIENCLVFAPVEGVFEQSEGTRVITKEEALRILEEAASEGLVHSAMNQQDQLHYICNCCTCSCGIMRGVAEFGIPTAVASSGFMVAVDSEKCVGCGACVDRCQFGALSIADDCARPDYARCVGCGSCVRVCPAEALTMERRPGADEKRPPSNFHDWLSRRAASRGLTMDDIT